MSEQQAATAAVAAESTEANGATEGAAQDAQASASQAPKPAEEKQTASQLVTAIAKEKKQRIAAQKELQGTRSQIAELQKKIEEMSAKFASRPENPEDALKRYGFTYDDVVSYQLNDKKPTAEIMFKRLDEKLNSFEEQQKLRETKAKEEAQARAKQEYEETLAAFKENAKEFLTQNQEKYELINVNLENEEAADFVAALIEGHFEKTKRIMTIAEAADLLERSIEEKVDKIAKAKKVQSKFTPATQQTQGKKDEPTTSKTLASAVTTSSAPSYLPAKTENERIARALAKLGGG